MAEASRFDSESTDGGFECKSPLYISQILSKSINEKKSLKKSLFVSTSKEVFLFNFEPNGSLALSVIDTDDNSKALSSLLIPTTLQNMLTMSKK